jgi:hypothetical protein
VTELRSLKKSLNNTVLRLLIFQKAYPRVPF